MLRDEYSQLRPAGTSFDTQPYADSAGETEVCRISNQLNHFQLSRGYAEGYYE